MTPPRLKRGTSASYSRRQSSLSTIVVEEVTGIEKHALRPRKNVSILGRARCSFSVAIAILEHWTRWRISIWFSIAW